MILLNSWADMTFHMKDIIYLGGIVFSAAVAYATITSNKKRINKLEEKTDDLDKFFGKLEVKLAEIKFDIIQEVRKIFNGKK